MTLCGCCGHQLTPKKIKFFYCHLVPWSKYNFIYIWLLKLQRTEYFTQYKNTSIENTFTKSYTQHNIRGNKNDQIQNTQKTSQNTRHMQVRFQSTFKKTDIQMLIYIYGKLFHNFGDLTANALPLYIYMGSR